MRVIHTNVFTAILTGLKALLGRFDLELIERENAKLYQSEKTKGDPNYVVSALIPSLIGKF